MYKGTVILEGGATRGVYTAGVLDYFMKKHLILSNVIGVSAGACNAVDYKSKQIGRSKNCMIIVDKDKEYYAGINKFVRKHSYIDMDLLFNTYVNEYFPFDFETYLASKVHCELVATSLKTGKADYFSPKNKAEIMLQCQASCSMPILVPPTIINGAAYLDGGIADSIPINRALEIGDEKIIVILTQPKKYRKKPLSTVMQRVYTRHFEEYPEFIYTGLHRHEFYNAAVEKIELLEQQGRIYVMRPTKKPVSHFEKKPEKLYDFYLHGYNQAIDEYSKILDYLNR